MSASWCVAYMSTPGHVNIFASTRINLLTYMSAYLSTLAECADLSMCWLVCQHLGANPNPKEPRQWSMFWGYIPKSEICFCTNLRHPSGLHAIRRIEKLLKSQMTWWVPLGWSRWRATKNSAVALSSRNYMISIHQRSAWKNEGKITLI